MNENITGSAAKENVALPLSNENALKKRNNLLKSVVGVSVLATGLIMAPQNAFAQEVGQPAAIVAPQEETGANTNTAPAEQEAFDNAVLDEEEEDKQEAVEAETTQADKVLNEEAGNVKETGLETPAEGTVEASAEGQAVEAAPAKATSAEAVNKEATAEEAGVETADAAVLSEEAAREAAKPALTAVAQPVITSETGLEFGEEKTPVAQGAGETSAKEETVPNYSEDEKKIKDYNESERYRQTDLQPGDVNQNLNKTNEKEEKDGFKFETKNPSDESPSKTEYGYQITIDKKTGQRTYTKIYVTDSGRVLANTGDKSMMEQGDKLTPESPDVTYKPNESGEITNAGRQKNYNYEASEDTLKHINNKENDSTSFGMKDNYTKDNPSPKFFEGDSFALGYKVNPWPNENDKLQELKLNKNKYDENKKHFVQGQDIDTGIKVDNIDENARERLVGQVYNPINGKVIEGAKAYIDEEGKVKIKMPAGAVNEDGTINKDSDFYKNPELRGLTSFDVKFFARPRTKEEFQNIANTGDEYSKGTYVGTGAGTADINHKGKNVTIDKQGIDRYDHYNLIGNFSLQLDDTRYYDQDFIDQDKKPTKDNMTSNIRPGTEFKVKMYTPHNPTEHQKTGEQMNEALKQGQASGNLDTKFLDKKNKEIADKLGVKYEDFISKDEYKEKRWNLVTSKDDIAGFSIVAPKNAKAGDFVALSVEYTYTNGSKDVQKFIFVVQDSTYIRPEYDSSVDFPTAEQSSKAKVIEDDKKTPPNNYSLPDTLEDDKVNAGNKIVKDDKGNSWTVSIDEKTGQVTAKPLAGGKFNGGEKLQVPVVAHYVDEDQPGKDITEETVAEFYIKEKANMTARYNAKAGKAGDKLSSDVILNEVDKYNRRPSKYTLESNTFTDDKGNTWNVTIDENTGKVTATVPNAEEGKSIDGALLNVPVTAHYYDTDGTEKGTRKVEVQFMAYGTNGKVEKTLEVPFETKVEKDPNLKKGEIKVITEGKKGSKKVTYTIEDSKITDTKEEEIEKPQDRLIKVGEGVNDGTHKIEEKVEVPFETEIEFDDSLKPGETKEVQKGEAGEKKRDVNLTIEDGKVTKTEAGEFTETKAPKKRIIKVGRNTEGKVEHKEELPFKYKVEEVEDLKKGEYRIVKPGKVGTKTTTWTIKNSKVEGEPTVTEVAAEDALIQVGKGTNEGTHEIKEKKALDYKTKIEYDENLDAGQQEVIKEGNPGEQERTNTLVIKDGQVTETKEGEFKTTKEATDRVVKVGTKPVTKVVEKPFNTEYVYDENLKAGETQEVTPGKNGKVTITTTYDKNQKKVVTSETEEKGQNRVVKIGGKTNGTEKIKEEIPFEVEVRKDPSLKKGEWKYATDDQGNELKGEKGEQEKTLTIVNSKVTETSEPTVTKKAKNAVVLVGEGTNDGTHEIKEKKELPFETRIEYDENLEAGQREETGGTPGEQERTNTLVIKDGKVEETKEGQFQTTKKPVDKVIKIGTKPIVKEVEKPFETEYIYDENVEMGKEEEVTPGEKGKVTITTSYDKDQNKLVTKEETKDPVKRVVKVGIKPVVKEESIPQNTKFTHNPNLKDGEIVKKSDGTPGKVTVTTTFNKETGKIETKVERTEPTDAEYEYGSKTEGKVSVKSDLPFEVEIIKDPEMEAGKTETIQEGKLGKKETTITIENSKEVSREEKVITDPVKKIVKVGTKCKCENPGNPGGNTPGGNTPGGNTPGGNTPGGNTPGGNTPGGNTPGGNTPGGNTPGGNTPGGNTPGGNTPGGNTPGGNTPGGNTPGGNTPGGNTPGGNTPGGNTPGGNTPGGNTPGGNTPGSEKPSDPSKEDPRKPGTTDPSDSGRINPSNTGKEGNDDEARRMAPAAQEGGRKADDDRKAPQTFDPGIAAPTGLGALASGLLIGLERLKRKNRK